MNELEALDRVFEVGGNEIEVDAELAQRAMLPLNRMLDFKSSL